MTSDNLKLKRPKQEPEELVSALLYKDNLHFWERAWGMVKTAHRQIPHLSYLDKIPSLLNSQGTQTVLDLGCGSGWLSIFLARKGFHVVGIDISAQAIELAKSWAFKEQLKIDFQVGDISTIVYPKASFDAVVANSIFEHLTYDLTKITLSNIREILSAKGLLIACFDKVGSGPGEYYELNDGTHVYTDKARSGMFLRYFTNQELKELFAGWTISVFEELPGGSRFVCAE